MMDCELHNMNILYISHFPLVIYVLSMPAIYLITASEVVESLTRFI